jgi:hypothetical protein
VPKPEKIFKILFLLVFLDRLKLVNKPDTQPRLRLKGKEMRKKQAGSDQKKTQPQLLSATKAA